MPLDDREKNFEKALRSRLQATCPDAETLAAYHERALAPDEMISWKKHIASCTTCQEVLAQLEHTDELVLRDEQQLTVAAAMSRRLVSGVKPAAPLTMPAMRVPQGGRSWRWAAPAGAIAAGLLVWVFVREMTPPKVAPQPAKTTIAENRTPAPPPPVTDQFGKSRETPPQSAASPRVEQRASTALKEIEPKQRDYDRKDAAAQAQTLPAPTQAAPPPVVSADVAKQSEIDKGLRDQAAAVNEKKEAANAELSQFMEQQRQAASGPAPAPSVEALRKTQQNQVAKSVGGRLITSEAAAQAKQEPNQKLKAGSLIPVISSDGKSVWRFGNDGSISNSQDQGRHWQSQTSGVAAQILAGSAPTDQVCWAVGTGGTIVRTVDGGAHWTKISSPISSDLGAVQASDDSHAQIWDLSRQLSYETRDGGTTWKQIAHR